MRFFVENSQARSELYARLANDKNLADSFWKAEEVLWKTISGGGKILIFGNGGSAAEAQHFAAELVCQFEKRRKAIPAIALTTDSSILTAQSNDFGFDSVFSRQIDALCRSGDVVIGLTTSDVCQDGHSRNILAAFMMAKEKEARTMGFFSSKTKHLLDMVDVAIIVPNENTALIQEVHQQVVHILCHLIEDDL